LRGSFVVGRPSSAKTTGRTAAKAASDEIHYDADRPAARPAGRPRGPALLEVLPEMIGPLLKMASTLLGLRDAASIAARKAALVLAAAIGGAVALFCFSTAGLTLLERHMDPAEAWAVVGGVYGVVGGILYLVATVRRRSA
jgi:hypothetical protein